ncbi:ScyD/ScyE family protein [uncultured Jatrophihabitans sp.]|uniref:ScyD/ScyE family protein n=1 Tax=uncultured Jatrophihabitans sp. TaxID=1610747 RepID=UPI0035C9D62B
MGRQRLRIVTGMAACAAAGIGVLGAPSGAGAQPAATTPLHVIKTLSTSYIAPLQFAVAGPFVVVADAGTGTLNVIGRDKPVFSGLGTQGSAAAFDPRTLNVGYSSTNDDHSATSFSIVSPLHKPVVADLALFEKTHNPDGKVQYGVPHPSKCVSDALDKAGIPANYNGQVDSHPYAATALGHGAWAVADAGGNDIVRVSRYGHPSTLAVLPRQALHVTSEFAAQNGLPKCTVGITYYFESVPTDVERGPSGWLYVSTLPGGEGVAGSVYRVNPHNGHATRIATGFAAATNIAVTPRGTVYVASLGDGTIRKVEHGRNAVVANLPDVVAIEWANNHLYASTAPVVEQEQDGPSGPSGPSGPPPHGRIVVLGR